MYFLYSNNGLSWRAADPTWAPAAGEVGFDHVPTTSELSTAFPGYSAAANVAQAQKTYAGALAAGVTITSTGTPALDGVYGTSAQDETNYLGLQSAVVAGVFPGYCRNKAGTKITMTGAQFTEIATAILDYIAALDDYLENSLAGQTVTPPSSSVTIA